MKSHKKTLILYTGGTFGMRPSGKKAGYWTVQRQSELQIANWIFEQVPELNPKRIEVEIFSNMDSCEMTPEHWIAMAKRIRKAESSFDSVLILHGTDTLAYTAAGLSFLLGPTKIPVILTGAQRPLSTPRNDARTNLISSLEVARVLPKKLRSRISVVFQDHVFLGTRIRKRSSIDYDAFESPRFPALGQIGSTIEFDTSALQKLKPQKPGLLKKISAKQKPARIVHLTVAPGIEDALPHFQTKNIDAVLLTIFTSGTVPTQNGTLLRWIEKLRKEKIQVIAVTERDGNSADWNSYEAGRKLLSAGILISKNMTPEAAMVKAQILTLAGQDLRQNWKKVYSDEMNS